MAGNPNQGPTDGITAHLTISDGKAAEAIDFYGRAFGAEEVRRHMADDGKRIMHAYLHVNGGTLMLNDEFPEYMSAPATPCLSLPVAVREKRFLTPLLVLSLGIFVSLWPRSICIGGRRLRTATAALTGRAIRFSTNCGRARL